MAPCKTSSFFCQNPIKVVKRVGGWRPAHHLWPIMVHNLWSDSDQREDVVVGRVGPFFNTRLNRNGFSIWHSFHVLFLEKYPPSFLLTSVLESKISLPMQSKDAVVQQSRFCLLWFNSLVSHRWWASRTPESYKFKLQICFLVVWDSPRDLCWMSHSFLVKHLE